MYLLNYSNKPNYFFRALELLQSKLLIIGILILNNLLKQLNRGDCFFIELDNLIYDDPHKWIEQFSKHDLCYMYDNENRFSSGIMYVKSAESIEGFLQYCIDFINKSEGASNHFMVEMVALSNYYDLNKDKVGILPTYWNSEGVPSITYSNYDKYNDTIFDSLAIGCKLLGLDTIHTNGQIVTNLKAWWCAIDYTGQKTEWQTDEQGLKKPYIWNGEKWLLINNLHVHSKDLKNGLSKDMDINI